MGAVNSSIPARYLHICWPAALEGLLIVLLSTVDLLMVSALGTEAVAAVGVFSQPKMVILCVSRSLAVSVTAIVARRYGAGAADSLPGFLKQMVLLSALLSGLLLLVTQITLPFILRFAGAQDAYLPEALAYARGANVSLLLYAPTLVINAGATGLGRTKAMLFSNVCGNLVNVLFNALFLFVLELGVWGAGLATAIGAGVTLLCSICFALAPNFPASLRGRADWRPVRGNLAEVKQFFFGIFLEQGFERMGMFLYSLLTAKLGMTDFATHNICMTLCDVFYSFGQGFSKTSLTLSGMLHAQGNHLEQRTLLRTAVALPSLCAVIAMMGYTVWRVPLMELFSTDEAVIHLGAKVLLLVAVCCIPEALSLSLSGVLRGIGQTGYVARYCFWSIAVIRPILTWLLCFGLHMGLYGAWIALLLDQTLRSICATVRVKQLYH